MKFFNTKQIDFIEDKYDKGEKSNISAVRYRREEGTRNTNVNFAMTYDELHEWSKNATDIFHFIESSFAPVTGTLKLHAYQKKIIDSFIANRFNVVSNSRQMGMSTLICALSLHSAAFNMNNISYILCCSSAQCNELMKRIISAYKKMPYYMKPGIASYTKTSVIFDNGSSIVAFSNTNQMRGASLNFNNLFINDYAFMRYDTLTGLFPILAMNRKTKVFIQSTPNGNNHFYDLVDKSRRGENSFVLTECRWWEVPGRDEEWKEQMIRYIGEDGFAQEFDCSYIIKRKTDTTK